MAESRLTAVVSTKGAVKAEKELSKLSKTAKVVDINVKKTGKSFKSFGKNAAAAVSAIDGPLGGISSRITAITSLASGGAIAFAAFAAAIVGSTFAIIKGISALDEYDVNLKRVNATIKATGAGVGFTGEQLLKEAEVLALATLTSVDAVQKAQAKLLTFNKVLGTEFTRAIRLSQDLAEAGFGSIESTALTLGKALQDPIKGMAALSRVGLTLSETQKQLAQDAVNAGDVFLAQGIILDAIAGQVEGVAAAVADGTLAGAIDTLGQNWDDLSRNVAKNSGALSVWTQIVRGAGRTAGILAEALEQDDSGDIFAKRLAATMRLNDALSRQLSLTDLSSTELQRQVTSIAMLEGEIAGYDKALNAAIKSENAKAKASAEALKLESIARKKITEDVKAEADVKLAKQKAIDDKKLARLQSSAQKELETLLMLNNSELEAIDVKEQSRLDKIKSSRDQELIGEQEFQAAKLEIEIKAKNDRKELLDKEKKENKDRTTKQIDDARSVAMLKAQIAVNALAIISGALDQESSAYKAAAIVSATISTFSAANSAYDAALKLGPVGLALAPVAAATAISAGLMNVRSIASAREQGGQLSAGQASTVAERGQLEILTPTSSSRIRTKQQMQQLMGNDSGGGNSSINIVNIDQSTGGVSIESSVDDDGRIIQLIRDTTALDASNPNSELRKTFAATTTLEARR